ncbi:unnamed protein product [Mucor circinelloides]|uniref:Uncharacterized protein n=1 Tax=Mucor circinelloides f. circinelloides (strain 1006PhL) TaxID=1220926 RepID=S2J2F9_MUCC1|nr:hypothetical protein HMPREF1544_10937 [Mucor circinelloides 1006PhL]
MTKSTDSSMPCLKIRLKLNTIRTDDLTKVQKSSSSPKSKSKKRTHKKRKSKPSKAGSSQTDVVNSDKLVTPVKPMNRTFYWTSERIESTKLILRTVILAN